jgi:flagellar protein FliS
MIPNPQAAAQYLRTRVLTATPEQLQMMLYDGAIRFGEQAKIALQAKKYEESFTLISKVQKILSELTGSLKHDIFPDLCGKLAALYTYAYRQLIDANIQHKIEPLDEAMNILRYQRETWGLLLGQLGKSKAAAMASTLTMPAPDARMEASISMCG